MTAKKMFAKLKVSYILERSATFHVRLICLQPTRYKLQSIKKRITFQEPACDSTKEKFGCQVGGTLATADFPFPGTTAFVDVDVAVTPNPRFSVPATMR